MKKIVSLLLCWVMVLSMTTIALAEIQSPTVYCDGSEVTATNIYDYNINDGTLTISWDKQSSAKTYYCKVIGLQEKPVFGNDTQSSQGTVLAEKTTSSTSSSNRKVTITKSKLSKYSYLKVATAVYDADGNQRWTNFGVRLTSDSGSSSNLTTPTVYCDDEKMSSHQIYTYQVKNGDLAITWDKQTDAAEYYCKVLGLQEAPDFDNSNQNDSGTLVKQFSTTSSSASKRMITITASNLKKYAYLKVAVSVMDDNDVEKWLTFGVQLVQEDTSGNLSVSSDSVSMDYDGDTATVTVSGASSYSISYPTQNESAGKKWLTVTKSGSVLTIKARENYGTSSRSETITVSTTSGASKTIKVTQKAGYAAPSASIKIGETTYSSGSSYGPLANDGDDVLWLSVVAKNAQSIYVDYGSTELGHNSQTITMSSSNKTYDCALKIPKGVTPGTYTLKVFVSNSDVSNDAWAQNITPITLNLQIVGTQSATISGSASFQSKVSELKSLFPEGWYWNHWTNPGSSYTVKKVTVNGISTTISNKPCETHKTGTKDSCNTYSGGKQCVGYARLIATVLCGKDIYSFPKKTGSAEVDNLRPGDLVRFRNDGHSVVVLSVSGENVYVTDANWDNQCGIRWNGVFTKSTLKATFTHVYKGSNAFADEATEKPTETVTNTPAPTVQNKTSSAGINFIKSYEGLRLNKYTDLAGKTTIGYGHVVKSGENIPDTITEEYALELLKNDLLGAENTVSSFQKSYGVTLNQNQFDALVSMVFNCGSAPLANECRLRSLLLEYKVGSNIPAWRVYNAMARWHHAGGVDVEGLYHRRMNEAKMFTAGSYSTATWEIPAWLKKNQVGPDVPDDWYSDYQVNSTSKPTESQKPEVTPEPEVSQKPTESPKPEPTSEPTEQPTTDALGKVSMSATGTVTAASGDTVTVPIQMNNPDAAEIGSVEIAYELPTGVTIVDVKATGVAATAIMVNKNPTAIVATTNAMTASGTIIEVTFKLEAGIVLPANIVMKPSVATQDGDVMVRLGNVVVAIAEKQGLKGDVNGDGNVNLIDIMKAAQYVYVDSSLTINMSNADVNGDGVVNLIDIMKIAKIVYPG